MLVHLVHEHRHDTSIKNIFGNTYEIPTLGCECQCWFELSQGSAMDIDNVHAKGTTDDAETKGAILSCNAF